MKAIIQKIHHGIHTVSIIIAIACLLGQLIVISINVILRQFGSGFSPMEELSTNILMPAMTLLSMALGVKLDLHINVNLFPKKTPAWFLTILDKFRYLVVMILGFIMLYFSIVLIGGLQGVIASMTYLPNMVQYIFIPIAGFLIMVDSFFSLIGFKLDDKDLDRRFDKIGETNNAA